MLQKRELQALVAETNASKGGWGGHHYSAEDQSRAGSGGRQRHGAGRGGTLRYACDGDNASQCSLTSPNAFRRRLLLSSPSCLHRMVSSLCWSSSPVLLFLRSWVERARSETTVVCCRWCPSAWPTRRASASTRRASARRRRRASGRCVLVRKRSAGAERGLGVSRRYPPRVPLTAAPRSARCRASRTRWRRTP